MEPPIKVNSEIGRLKTVLLHRPGEELEALTPDYMARMLFDDVPYLKDMTLLPKTCAIMAVRFFTLTNLPPKHFPLKKYVIASSSKWFAPPSKRIPIPPSPSSTTYKASTRSQWSEKSWPVSRRVKLKSWSQKTNSFIIT